MATKRKRKPKHFLTWTQLDEYGLTILSPRLYYEAGVIPPSLRNTSVDEAMNAKTALTAHKVRNSFYSFDFIDHALERAVELAIRNKKTLKPSDLRRINKALTNNEGHSMVHEEERTIGSTALQLLILIMTNDVEEGVDEVYDHRERKAFVLRNTKTAIHLKPQS